MTDIRPMTTAPKDGSLVWLLVEILDLVECDCPISLIDDESPGWTIGFNLFVHNGNDYWSIVGWDWCFDEFKDLNLSDNGYKLLGWQPTNRPRSLDYEKPKKSKG